MKPRHARLILLLTALVGSLGGCAPAPLASLRNGLDAIFDDARYASAYWGVRIERLNGEVLYERNSGKEFAPASNMKIFTTAAALDLLGPNYTYETRLEAVGDISDGVLDGDLVIVGSGDPSLGGWHPDPREDSNKLLADWVSKIKAAGIHRVNGDVIGDGRCFTVDSYSPNWVYGDLCYWYAAGTSGLAIEENAYRCVIRPGGSVGDPARIEIIPRTSYVTILNQTRTGPPKSKSDADSTWQETEGNTRRFVGSIALDNRRIDERGSVYDGARYAAHLLVEALDRADIRVGGKALNIRALTSCDRIDSCPPEHRRVIARTVSPPVGKLVAVVNKISHNFYADQIQRTMGLRKAGEGSFAAGAKVMRQWLKDIDAPDSEGFQTFDGSGLARDDFVQPRQICHVLRHMRRDDAAGKAFYDSLPIGGVDGTLEKRFKNLRAKGIVRAKTGYISHVRALSGYVTTAGGEELVFSMICNQYLVPTSQVNESQDRAVEMLASLG